MSNILKQLYDETQHILGKLELPDLVRWQINRVNTSSGEPELFGRNVEVLMYMLPSNKLEEILNRKSEYVDVIDDYVYKYSCGRRLGSIERPFYINREDDPNWDGGKPILVSPIKQTMEMKNYDKLYMLILKMLEESGLTWHEEQIEIEAGDIVYAEKPDTTTPHPTYDEV